MSCTCGTGYCEDHPPMPTRTNKAKPMNDKLCTMHGSKYVPVVLHGRQVWHCPECVKQNNPMSDKHQEAAETLFDSWLYGDNPENTMLIQDIASALRQVEREPVELSVNWLMERGRRCNGEATASIKRAGGQMTKYAETLTLEAEIAFRYAQAIRSLSPTSTANELPTTQELADVSTPGELIDRDQAIIATSVEADFERGTWTFEPKGQWSVSAGDYYLIPIQAAEKGE